MSIDQAWIDDLVCEVVLLERPQHEYVDRKYEILCNLFPESYLAGCSWWLGGNETPSQRDPGTLPRQLADMVSAWREQWNEERVKDHEWSSRRCRKDTITRAAASSAESGIE